jgi:hypothetical protein
LFIAKLSVPDMVERFEVELLKKNARRLVANWQGSPDLLDRILVQPVIATLSQCDSNASVP